MVPQLYSPSALVVYAKKISYLHAIIFMQMKKPGRMIIADDFFQVRLRAFDRANSKSDGDRFVPDSCEWAFGHLIRKA